MNKSAHEISWIFPFCPEPPDWNLNWDAVEVRFNWVSAMKGCRQDAQWHAEGDVSTHTRMACESLIQMKEWRSLPVIERNAIFAATLLHDIAKPRVSIDLNGRIHSPHHSSRGARMTRCLLYQELLPTLTLDHLRLREKIVQLVRFHGLPLSFLEKDDPKRTLIAASQTVQLDHLALLAQADAEGRHCQDQQELLSRIDLFREFAHECKCYLTPRAFASEHTRYLYLQGRNIDPDIEAFDDSRLDVILMSGLPGSGKDQWISTNTSHLPVVSLDSIREQLKVRPEDDQGTVVMEARRQAREYLRAGTPFIWNATNVSRSIRRLVIELFRRYGARVRIVYVETAWKELILRNSTRTKPVPESVLNVLVKKLEVPNITDVHRVDFVALY